MHRCSYSRERASEAFSKRGSKQELLTLTQTHRQPPVQGWRRRSGWALRAIEKTDASVPAHEDERAARGRETFPYATFHEDIRKKRSNFALASSILRGSTAGSSNQVCFQLRCNPFHWCHVYFAGLPAEWNTNSVNCEYCIDSTKYFTRNTGGIFWKA